MERNRFFLGVIFILLFAMAARTPLDTDMWWHLRAGEQTWQTGRPMTVDTFSYTRQGATWINHSWLSQLGMYLTYRLGGFLALGALVALLAAISMALIYAQMEGHPLVRAFVLILASAVAAPVWSPRPQLVSLVMFGVTGYIIYLFKWRGSNYLWVLPFVFILWSNLHGGYVLGLLLLSGMIVGEALNHLLGIEGGEVLSWKGIGQLGLWALTAALVVVINPNGLAMWTIPFRTVGVQVLQNFIPEWASPDFHDLVQQPFLWLLFGTFGAVAVSRRRMDGTDLVSLVGFAYLALVARRNFGPFAMVAAPVLSRHLWPVAGEWSNALGSQWLSVKTKNRWLNLEGNSKQLVPQMKAVTNILILGMLALAGIFKLYSVTTPDLVSDFEQEAFPLDALEWVKNKKPPGNLFNSYNWGGFLIWNLPEYKVFVDGRTDLYNDELLREYLLMASGSNGCLNKLDDYSINVVLVETDSGLGRVLGENTEWERVFQDDIARVFVRKSAVTSEDIPRYLR